MRFYTYLYRDIDGTPIYVGKGTGRRALSHFKADSHLGRLLKKRLRDGHKIKPEFLCKDVDEEFAFFVEIEMIRHYGRKDLGIGTLFNLTDGGDGNSGCITQRGVPKTGLKAKGLPATGKAAKGHIKSEEAKVHLYGNTYGNGNKSRNGFKLTKEQSDIKSIRHKGIMGTGKNTKGLKLTCPHCGKIGGGSAMMRWHFDNCKNKGELI